MRRNKSINFIFLFLKLSQLWIAHITLTIMVGSLFFQVIARHVNWQLDWTEELSRFAFISMIFVASSYATQSGSHLRVEFFSELISNINSVSRWIVIQLQWLAVLTFDVLFTWYSYENLMEGFQYPNMSPALNFNEGLLFIAPMVGFAVTVIYRLLSKVYEPPVLDAPSSGEITS
jgi:TRAP-type C4-dicarboxylate transport system permease small subunit